MGLLDGTIEFNRDDTFHSDDQFELPVIESIYDQLMIDIGPHFADVDWGAKPVLDYACGSGGYGRRFIKLGADVSFIDGREGNLKKVTARFPDA